MSPGTAGSASSLHTRSHPTNCNFLRPHVSAATGEAWSCVTSRCERHEGPVGIGRGRDDEDFDPLALRAFIGSTCPGARPAAHGPRR